MVLLLKAFLKVWIVLERVNPFLNEKFFTLPNRESLQMTILYLMKLAESTEGKGEIAHYEQFLLFPQCFQTTCTADA